jgi:Tfp pilus assembly protein PilF
MVEAAPTIVPLAGPQDRRAGDEVRRTLAAALERQNRGDAQGAIDFYVRALELRPDLPDPYNNIAVLLKGMRRLPAAVACLRRAVQLAPASASLWSNLGNMLWMSLDFDRAGAAFRRALDLEPTRPETHHNLGLLQFSKGDYQLAIESYDRALALAPGNTLIMWDRALALLASGDLARGFAAYDTRFDLNDPSMQFDLNLKAVRSIPLPMWQGEDLRGKTLFVYAEQGLGDTIQFARFLPVVAQHGARIVFDCQPELVRLMSNLAGVAELRPQFQANPLPAADFHLPLMSLPSRLGATLANLPNTTPYLSAPLAVVGPSVPRPPGTRLAIGIVWAGRPHHSNDHNRSMTLEHFFPLAELPGVALYSLQMGPRAADIGATSAAPLVCDLRPQIQDFADTARLIQQLDLVIGVDTSVVHLAGALGRSAFVLLPYTADWRWLGRREDSPWYPALRLFRQQAPNDWQGVIARVHDWIAAMLVRG